MKKILVLLVLMINVGLSQHTFEQIYRNNGSGANGSTWAAGATHYTEWIDMRDIDSAWVGVDFPDSVDVDIYVENRFSTTGVTKTSSRMGAGYGSTDSIRYVTDGTGISTTCSLTGNYITGYALCRLKLVFQTGCDTQGIEKYKLYIKKFRNRYLTKQ